MNDEQLQEAWSRAPRVVRDADRIIGVWAFPWCIFSFINMLLASLHLITKQGDVIQPVVFALLAFVIAKLHFNLTSGLIRGKPNSWGFTIALTSLQFLIFPIGTVTSVIIWSRWFSPQTRAWFNSDSIHLPEAKQNLQSAVQSPSELAQTYFNTGVNQYEKRHFEEAIVSFNEAIKYDPTFAEAQLYLGSVFGEIGNREQEIVQYKKVIELEPSYSDGYLELGLSYVENNELDLAKVQYQSLIALDEDKANELLFAINKKQGHKERHMYFEAPG